MYKRQHILGPLDMSRSNISFIRSTLDDNVETLYTFEDGKWRIDKDFQNDAFVLNGGGAMKSTLADLKKYMACLLYTSILNPRITGFEMGPIYRMFWNTAEITG